MKLYDYSGQPISQIQLELLTIEGKWLNDGLLSNLTSFPILSNTYVCTENQPDRVFGNMVPFVLFFIDYELVKDVFLTGELNGANLRGITTDFVTMGYRYAKRFSKRLQIVDFTLEQIPERICVEPSIKDNPRTLRNLMLSYIHPSMVVVMNGARVSKFSFKDIRTGPSSVSLAKLLNAHKLAPIVLDRKVYLSPKGKGAACFNATTYHRTLNPQHMFMDDNIKYLYKDQMYCFFLIPKPVYDSELNQLFHNITHPGYHWINLIEAYFSNKPNFQSNQL